MTKDAKSWRRHEKCWKRKRMARNREVLPRIYADERGSREITQCRDVALPRLTLEPAKIVVSARDRIRQSWERALFRGHQLDAACRVSTLWLFPKSASIRVNPR